MNRRRCNTERRLARWRARRSNKGIGLRSLCMVDGREVMVSYYRWGGNVFIYKWNFASS